MTINSCAISPVLCPLHPCLEPLITPGILTDVGVAGIVLLLLHLILPGVLRPLVVLEVPAVSEWPEDTMIVTNIAGEPPSLRVDRLDMS